VVLVVLFVFGVGELVIVVHKERKFKEEPHSIRLWN
jgi:hypothetical protein